MLKKKTRGTFFWERSIMDDLFEAIDKLYITHLLLHEHLSLHNEYDANLDKAILKKMDELANIAVDLYDKSTSININVLLNIKKATLIVDSVKQTILYIDMPHLIARSADPPAYSVTM